MSGTVKTTRLSARFRDVAEAGRAAAFNLGFRQLDSGPAPVDADILLGTRMSIVSMKFSRAYHQLGEPPASMRTFGLPIRGFRSWNGRNYDELSILPFNLPDGIDGVSEAGFEAFTLAVDGDYIGEVATSFQIPIADIVMRPTSGTAIRNCESNQRLRRLLLNLTQDRDALLDSQYQDEVTVALLHASLSDTETVDRSNAAHRARAVSKALNFIRANFGNAISVRGMCNAIGVPLRTINRAFRERFGIGPKAYLIRQRLSDVHRELVCAPRDTLVADVANRHAFWHMGQFAKDYKAMFGELPSDTLMRSRTEQ